MRSWIESETEVLARVVADRRTLANAIHFVLQTAFPPPEHTYGDGVWVGQSLTREQLGLVPGRRPGDVDLLIIPTRDERVMSERAIAVEVKIVRPTFERPQRNSNSFGVTQALGLLEDGFPFVGLLHISIPSPLPSNLHLTVPHLSPKLGPDRQPSPTGEFYTFDPFPLYSAQRQEGRLEAMELPAELAYSSIAFTLSRDGERVAGNTIGNDRRGCVNPKLDASLLDRVQELTRRRPGLFTKVRWFDADAS